MHASKGVRGFSALIALIFAICLAGAVIAINARARIPFPLRSTGENPQERAAAEPHTSDAVIADDNGWSKAEETGDISYIDRLLMPEYRSVNVDGSIHDKNAILAGARKSSPERTAKINAYRAAHPYKTSTLIVGDTAVLTFALDGGSMPIMSCDVFVYRDGHWRALYSQHTSAGS
jgi:hypothetical protein